jgi:hypothetical protein
MATEWDSFPLADHPLDSYLGGVLAGHGAAFEQAGATYGVDPRLLAAIATFESGHGTSHLAKAYNNPTGMTVPNNPKQYQKFASIPDAINATAKDLAENYLKRGLTTIPQIAAEYAPPKAANDPNDTNAQWPGSVQKLYAKMGGTRTTFGPQQVGPGVAIMGGYNEPTTETVPIAAATVQPTDTTTTPPTGTIPARSSLIPLTPLPNVGINLLSLAGNG